MEGRVRDFSRNMKGQESSYSGLYEEKSKSLCLYAHFPMYVGIGSKAACTQRYCIKSHVYT